MDFVAFNILGDMASSKNRRRIVTSRASMKPMLIKSVKAIDWWHSATQQLLESGVLAIEHSDRMLIIKRPLFTGPVRVTIKAFYASERSDLDIELLKDVLQSRYSGRGKARKRVVAGIYENDRQVREMHIFHRVDANAPRVFVTIEELT